jgi:hypothetical protein
MVAEFSRFGRCFMRRLSQLRDSQRGASGLASSLTFFSHVTRLADSRLGNSFFGRDFAIMIAVIVTKYDWMFGIHRQPSQYMEVLRIILHRDHPKSAVIGDVQRLHQLKVKGIILVETIQKVRCLPNTWFLHTTWFLHNI